MTEPGTHVIPLYSRRQAKSELAGKLQHFGVAIAVLSTGLKGLKGAEGLSRVIAFAEIAAGALVILLMLRAIRELRRGHVTEHHGVDWLDIGVAALLGVEVWEHWHETGHIRRPSLLLAFIALAQGLWHAKLIERVRQKTALRVDDDGIRFGRWPRRFDARWSEIASITIEPDRAVITTKAGRVRNLRLADLSNADQVRAALESARQRLAFFPR